MTGEGVSRPMTGPEVRKRREAMGLTQGEFAELLGVALNTVSRWELGRIQIADRSARLIELATAGNKARRTSSAPKRKR
jgi:DNA-binding transcriptional regulator YiaG